jgi:hypothetical protein
MVACFVEGRCVVVGCFLWNAYIGYSLFNLYVAVVLSVEQTSTCIRQRWSFACSTR